MAELIHNQCSSGGAGVSLWAGPDVVSLKAITVTDSPAVVGVFFLVGAVCYYFKRPPLHVCVPPR